MKKNIISQKLKRSVLTAMLSLSIIPGVASAAISPDVSALNVAVNVKDGVEIINIPLINYLLILKSDLYASMDSQEFLDRESEWSMIFFLSPNLEWIKTYIKINDWTVRINDIGQ